MFASLIGMTVSVVVTIVQIVFSVNMQVLHLCSPPAFFFFFSLSFLAGLPGLLGSSFLDQGLNLDLAVKALSLNHWTTGEIPMHSHF